MQRSSKGYCNHVRLAKGNPLVCDNELHGLAIMGCSNIHLYTNITNSISWINSNMQGSTVPYEVCSGQTKFEVYYKLETKAVTKTYSTVEKAGFPELTSIRPKVKNVTQSFDYYNASEYSNIFETSFFRLQPISAKY